MKKSQTSSRSKSRVKSRSNTFLFTVCISIILFVAIFYFYTKEETVNANSGNQQVNDASVNTSTYSSPDQEGIVSVHSNDSQINKASVNQYLNKTSVSTYSNAPQIGEEPQNIYSHIQQPSDEFIGSGVKESAISLEKHSNFNSPPQTVNESKETSVADSFIAEKNPIPSINPLTIQLETDKPFKETYVNDESIDVHAIPLIKHLNEFYEHLDRQPYMKAFNLNTSSKVHFSRLLQKLADAPPVVTNETDDLFTILKNTAHFFRVLGKENIIVLKGILDREKASVEDILQIFYALTAYPEALKNEYALTLPQDALYDYAGFFLNTMGGRLYLFRRDSASRMTVSFYAIQIIDKAIKEGNNKHGINLPPAIDFLINEMENTGKHLLLKEDYLDTLYDLKEMYNN